MSESSPKFVDNDYSAASARWWESYLVRYFIGSIVGTFCIYTICISESGRNFIVDHLTKTTNTKPESELTTLLITQIVLGIAYCYIVSAPITVLHAARYSRGAVESYSRSFWPAWIGLVTWNVLMKHNTPEFCIAMILLVISIPSSIILYIHKQKIFCKAAITYIQSLFIFSTSLGLIGITKSYFTQENHDYLVLGIPAIWVGFCQYIVLHRMLSTEADFLKFYGELTLARQVPGLKDIRDTYTHLREHSNAIFIVVLELAVLAIFLQFKPTLAPSGQIDSRVLALMLGALGFWLVPTIYMWGRANVIENYLRENPENFTRRVERRRTPNWKTTRTKRQT